MLQGHYHLCRIWKETLQQNSVVTHAGELPRFVTFWLVWDNWRYNENADTVHVFESRSSTFDSQQFHLSQMESGQGDNGRQRFECSIYCIMHLTIMFISNINEATHLWCCDVFFNLQVTHATEWKCNSSITICHHNNVTLIVLTKKRAGRLSFESSCWKIRNSHEEH